MLFDRKSGIGRKFLLYFSVVRNKASYKKRTKESAKIQRVWNILRGDKKVSNASGDKKKLFQSYWKSFVLHYYNILARQELILKTSNRYIHWKIDYIYISSLFEAHDRVINSMQVRVKIRIFIII